MRFASTIGRAGWSARADRRRGRWIGRKRLESPPGMDPRCSLEGSRGDERTSDFFGTSPRVVLLCSPACRRADSAGGGRQRRAGHRRPDDAKRRVARRCRVRRSRDRLGGRRSRRHLAHGRRRHRRGSCRRRASPAGSASVCFVDPPHGWAAGGATQPYSHASRGVLLTTSDGGATWTEIEQSTLPAITRVKFFDAERGIAAGGANPLFPVRRVRDARRRHEPGSRCRPTRTASGSPPIFPTRKRGAVAGPAGRFATLMRRRVVHSPSAVSSSRAYRALRLAPPTGGWLVGDGGLVMTTHDLGNSWQTPPGDLPDVRRARISISTPSPPPGRTSGSPARRARACFTRPTAGNTWQPLATGQNAPLRAITFVDAQHRICRRRLGHDPRHQRRRPHLASAAPRRRAGGAARGAGRRDRRAARARRQTRRRRRLSHGGQPAACRQLDRDRTARSREAHAARRGHGDRCRPGSFRCRRTIGRSRPTNCSPSSIARTTAARSSGSKATWCGELRMWRPDVVVTHHIAQTGRPIRWRRSSSSWSTESLRAAADPNQYPELAADVGLARGK